MTLLLGPAVGEEYAAYREVLLAEATRPPHEWTFKGHAAYRRILEHVSPEQADQYVSVMESEFPTLWKQLRGTFLNTAVVNDSYGSPERAHCASLARHLSPTNTRYMWQALHIWRHLHGLGLDNVDVVELGGGYGGLALYLQWAFPGRFRSYTIVDVPEAGAIQAAFARELNFSLRVVDGTNPQAMDWVLAGSLNPFLVSAYGFSEFSPEVRAWYEHLVVPHCAHGWLVWNVPPVYPFTTAPLTVEDENPQTGRDNVVVRF